MAVREIMTSRRGPGLAAVVCAIGSVLVGLAGCESAGQQRMKQFNDDGVYLFKQGNYQAARASFAMALEAQPEDPALFYNLGQCCDRLGDLGKAEQYYQEALRRAPNHGVRQSCRRSMRRRTKSRNR